MNNIQRKDIQFLRGIAVIAVLLFHAFPSQFKNGLLGVDLFFAISGYVITPKILAVISSGRGGVIKRSKDFYLRRFRRLTPALAVMVIFSLPAILLLGPISDHKRAFTQALAGQIGIANFSAYFLAGNYFHPNPNPYTHAWSLSVEQQIYLILPWILLLGRKLFKINFRNILAFLTGCSFLIFEYPSIMIPIYRLLGFPNLDSISFYSTTNRFWEFGLGGLISLLSLQKLRFTHRALYLVSLLILICLIFLNFGTTNHFSNVLVVLLACFLISIPSSALSGQKSVIALVGDASYSIYLWHLPILYLLRYAPIVASQSKSKLDLFSIFGIVLSISLGLLSYKWIEKRYIGNDLRDDINSIKAGSISTCRLLVISLIITSFTLLTSHTNYFGKITQERSDSLAEISANCSGGLCNIIRGKLNRPILIMGDSHAGQYSPILKEFGRDQDASVFYGNDEFLHGAQFKQWLRINAPVVIFSRYWRSDPVEVSMWMVLREYASSVYILGNNPVYPDETLFMNKGSLVTRAYKPAKSYPFAELISEIGETNLKLQLAARHFKFIYVNTPDAFCTKKQCSRYGDNKWLYVDDDHLSYSGTRRVLTLFEHNLKRDLQKIKINQKPE